MELREFIGRHVATIETLEKEMNLAYWDAAISGTGEDFKRYSELQLRLEKVYTSKEDFAFVKRIKKSGKLQDDHLARMVDLLYLRYLGNQIDSTLLQRIVDLSTKVENKFNIFRAKYDGKEISTNEIYEILRKENDSEKRRKIWEANKRVGPIVLTDMMELVTLRNEAARQLGFDNYYTMSLTLAEQSEDELVRIFAELEELTRKPFLKLKGELDESLSKRYGIRPQQIRPWHYHDPYFQEAPQTDKIDLDLFYRGKDPVEIAKHFYDSIGMTVDDILARSDLYEKEGKNPHAFCTDMDRKGDVRILANMKDNNYWMETILHELGHGVYDKYIDPSLPYILRTYPHICMTEASAMYFSRFSHDPAWMRAALGLDEDKAQKIAPKIQEFLRLKQLIFARWCQTMYHFERGMYKNPNQDLNKLWWDIVERFQFVKRPEGRNEPDWATKIHIVSSPVYYHNYMLGELIASQLHHYVKTKVLDGTEREVSICSNRSVGRYFLEVVYKPGDTLPWDKHVERITGEPLTARYFVEQFVEERN